MYWGKSMATYNLPCHLSGSGDCDGSPSTFTTTVVTNSASLGDDSLRCQELWGWFKCFRNDISRMILELQKIDNHVVAKKMVNYGHRNYQSPNLTFACCACFQPHFQYVWNVPYPTSRVQHPKRFSKISLVLDTSLELQTLSATARSRQATLNHVYLHPLVGAAFLSPSLGDWNHMKSPKLGQLTSSWWTLYIFDFFQKNRKINWFSTSNPSPQKRKYAMKE